MRSISTVKDEFLLLLFGDLQKEIQPIFGDKLEKLVLFGSYARGEQEKDSDIDIMVLVDESEEKLKTYNQPMGHIMTELMMKHDRLISLIEIPAQRFNKYVEVLPFYKNVYDEGVEIYGRPSA